MRRRSLQVRIGTLVYGGSAPVVLEAMTKGPFSRMEGEIEALVEAGAELVRVAVNSKSDARRFLALMRRVPVPLMADVHFSWDLARLLIEEGAPAVRVNPGNMAFEGSGFESFARAAAERATVVRVGSNSGSAGILGLPPQMRSRRLADIVLQAAAKLEGRGVKNLILGAKSSDIRETSAAMQRIARLSRWPLHVGITATGSGLEALCRSAIAIGGLLLSGIGDGVRVSLCGGSVEEVHAGKAILQAVDVRRFGPRIIACPTCTRCKVDLAAIVEEVAARIAGEDPSLTVAVMGCVVNGPQEAADADFGVAFSNKTAALFAYGHVVRRLPREEAIEALLEVIREARG